MTRTPEQCRTKMVRPVFPSDTNHHGNLFGGMAVAWMDQAAYVCATRWTQQRKIVTAHIDAVDFQNPVRAGTVVEVDARLVEVGRTSMQIEVDMWVEPLQSEEHIRVCRGRFVMVALGDDERPTPVPKIE